MDKKTIVLTMYGNGDVINNFTVTLFDDSNPFGMRTVQDYCCNINELELKDDNWIHAVEIRENEKIKFEKPRKFTDFNILCSLDDHDIQRVLHKIDHDVLVRALIPADRNILVAVIKNMSKRSVKILLEDMEYSIFPTTKEDIKKAQRQIVEIIQHMERTGEITVPRFSQNEKNNNEEQQI
jgi:flagellar motor switch protein FliG